MAGGLIAASAIVVQAAGIAPSPAAPLAPKAHAVAFPVLERDWVHADNGPQPPANGAMAYDQKDHETVLLVPGHPSQTWVFDGGSQLWSQQFPADTPNLVNASAADDSGSGVVVFGSNAGASTCDPTVMGETWKYDGATWTRLHPANAPNECAGLGSLAMASYRNVSGGAILVITLPGGTAAETWRWTGTNWILKHRSGPMYAPVADFELRTLSFGGTMSNGDHNDFGVTRTLRGSPWETVDPGGRSGDPAPRSFASLTVDLYDGAVMFGGIEHSASPHLLNDTWRRYLGRWVRMGTRTSPPPMSGASFVYDEAHDVSVLFGKGTWLLAPARAGGGYLMCASDGGVFTFGDAHFYGSTGGMHLNQPIVGIARTPTRKGYWLVARDGGVFTFGDARFYGSAGNLQLEQPIIAIAPTASGRGYWLVASDGGVFTFGDAAFLGSTANRHLDQPIVAVATVLYGRGYLLVARDGRVFAFGDALLGRAHDAHMGRPVVGIARKPSTFGYWIVNATGGLFTYAAEKFGNETGLHAPIVAIVASPTTRGYWLFGPSGRVYAFGDAQPYGNAPANLEAPIVAATAT